MQYPGSEPWAYTKNNGNDNLAKAGNNVVDNIVEEVHAIEWVATSASYKMENLNLEVLREEQFCMKTATNVRLKQVDGFVLDEYGILQKMVRLKYTIDPTIVVPRKLTSHIIVEVHNGKGHQGISCTVNMIRYYFLVGQHAQRCAPTHQELPAMYSIST